MANVSAVLSHLLHNHILAVAVLVYQWLFEVVVRMAAKNQVYAGCFCCQTLVVVFVLYFPSEVRDAHYGITSGLF